MKIYYRLIITILLGSIFSGCSILYGVKKDTTINTLKYNKNIKDISTGTTNVFLGDNRNNTYENFSRYFRYSNGSKMSLYNDDKDIYFKYNSKIYGITKESEKYKTQGMHKISSKDIICKSKDKICLVLSKAPSYKIIIRKGFAGDIEFDFLNYSKVKDKYNEAIEKYDYSLVSKYKDSGVKGFLNKNTFSDAIAKAKSLKQLDALLKIAKNENIVIPEKYIVERKNQINFEKKYNFYISTATETQLDELLKDKEHLVGISKTKIENIKHKKHILALQREKQRREKILNSNSVEKISNYYASHNDNDVKKALVNTYRGLGTLDAYKSAYELSNSLDDLTHILKLSNTIQDLEFMLSNYSKSSPKIVLDTKRKLLDRYRALDTLDGYLKAYKLFSSQKDEDKILAIYRAKDSFDGYISAYKFSHKIKDIKKAYKKAKTLNEKVTIEQLAFDMIKTKDTMINVSLSVDKPSFSRSNNSGGFFSQSSQYGRLSVYGNLSVKLTKNNLPFIPKFGTYKVKINLKLTIPRNKQVRSNWVGNRDTSSDNISKITISTYLKPPYKNIKKSFSFKNQTFVYFDRGMMGGFTAIWPSDTPRLEVASIEVLYEKYKNIKNQKLYINFDKLEKYSRTMNYPKVYISNVYNKGVEWINNFANNNIGRYKSHNTNYTSSASSSSTSNHASSSNRTHHSSSSSTKQGVKRFVNNGKISGAQSWSVRCYSSKSVVIYKKNGTWYTGGLGHMGHKFDSWSRDRVGNYLCR